MKGETCDESMHSTDPLLGVQAKAERRAIFRNRPEKVASRRDPSNMLLPSAGVLIGPRAQKRKTFCDLCSLGSVRRAV